jgi:hypothetical protein
MGEGFDKMEITKTPIRLNGSKKTVFYLETAFFGL